MQQVNRLDWNWRTLNVAVHLLLAALLAVLLVRGFTADHRPHWALLGVAGLTTLVYLVGLSAPVRTHRGRSLLWLLALVGAWTWLLWLAPEAVYLAFPLFFLAAHLLGTRSGIAAVATLTGIAVCGYSAHHGISFGAVIGPCLGALVAVATVLGMRAVQRESARRGVLEERERLAREVHDTLAQGLSSINLMLGAAAAEMPASRAADLVREAREIAVDNLAEARRFVHAMSPPALDRAPLPQALGSLVEATPGAGLTVTGSPCRLPNGVDATILRVAREALTNATRHSGAERVAVTLSYLDGEVALDVVDNGLGFDPGLPAPGFGLASMATRAAEVGGRLSVESAPGSGTAVACMIPLPGALR